MTPGIRGQTSVGKSFHAKAPGRKDGKEKNKELVRRLPEGRQHHISLLGGFAALRLCVKPF
ncbi:MAG: hypothetical protein ABSA30_13695, partial [Candidatus Aminicenantales bacterium]